MGPMEPQGSWGNGVPTPSHPKLNYPLPCQRRNWRI